MKKSPPSIRPASAPGRRYVPRDAVLAAVLALFGFFVVAGIPQRLDIPFHYAGGDTMYYLTFAKTIQDTGGWFHNPFLGAPAGADLVDLPNCDLLHLVTLKLLCFLTGNWAVAVNIFYLAGYPLAAITALLALRQLGISRAVAVTISVLFALAPYHFFQNQDHLMLSAYFMLPLAILVALRLMGPDDIPRRRFLAAVAVIALTTASGLYYGFFSAYLVLIGGAVGFVLHRRPRRLAQTGLLLLVSIAMLGVQTLPTWLYQMHHGANPTAITRKATDAEAFALKFTYLVLPVANNRIPILRHLFHKYNDAFLPNVNESNLAGLGAVAAIGFLSLLAIALIKTVAAFARRVPSNAGKGEKAGPPIVSNSSLDWLGPLATLNLAAFLLATYGGIGAIFSLLVSPIIRAYDRMSICIAFLALAAAAIGLDELIALLRRRYRAKAELGRLIVACLILFALISAYDQIPDWTPDYRASADSFNSDADFVHAIESAVPRGSRIFQLPYMPFPESTPPGLMADYDLFRGYLHSSTLCWSYGAVRGRPGDIAYRDLAQLPPPQLVAALRSRNYAGIYLDRAGVTDPAYEPALVAAARTGSPEPAGTSELVSADPRPPDSQLPDTRLVFIPLAPTSLPASR